MFCPAAAPHTAKLPKAGPMLLTQCAVCAADLGLTLGKKCGRCSTRYCGPECQVQHWKEGGHDTLCKKIKKAGGAEQYNANEKYSKTVAVAVEKCADDTKGQTCFICTQALHWKTKEGLVRGCSCRGTAGFAHVSCLAEQAKLLNEEAEENGLFGTERGKLRWRRWNECSLCEQDYHGVVYCALGWACWKTYLGRPRGPEADWLRGAAMTLLGNGLFLTEHYADASSVFKARYSTLRRTGASEHYLLIAAGNLANSYQALGRCEEALRLRQEVYSGHLKLNGEEYYETLREANNYASSLIDLQRFKEARSLMRKTIHVTRRVLGKHDDLALRLRWNYAKALYLDTGATFDDLREAVATFEEIGPTARRVLGGAHPDTRGIEKSLRDARAALRARETADDLAARFGGL